MRNVRQILQSLKDYKGFKTSTELAEFLGIGKSAQSNWLKRETLDENLIHSKMPEVRLEFLRTGELPMTEPDDLIGSLLKRIDLLEKRIEELERYGKD